MKRAARLCSRPEARYCGRVLGAGWTEAVVLAAAYIISNQSVRPARHIPALVLIGLATVTGCAELAHWHRAGVR